MDSRWLTLGAVGALAAAGLARRGSADVGREKTITRAGFPWPADTVLYHGTYAMEAIRRQGFVTRQMGAPSMTGGGHHKSVSTTLLPQRAAAIALGLHTLARVAQRQLSLSDLVYALKKDAPESVVDGVTALADWVRSLATAAPYTKEALHEILTKLDLLDDGWTYVTLRDDPKEGPPYRVPRGSIELRGTSWLVPPGSSLPTTYDQWRDRARRQGIDHSMVGVWASQRAQGSHHGRCDAAFRIYKAVVDLAGMSHQEVFNPHFMGTNVAALGKVPLSSIGVLRLNSAIPRICTDQRGAIRLGYLDVDDRVRADTLTGWFRDCDEALEGRKSWSGAPYAQRDLWGTWDSWIKEPARWQGWTVEQTGRRTRDGSMLYYDGEEEVRVFAPERLLIVRTWSVPDLRRRFGLGDRVTFPWLDARTQDVRIWPPRRSS